MKSLVSGLLAIVVTCFAGMEATAQDYWSANLSVPRQVIAPRIVAVPRRVVQQATAPQRIVVERTVQREVLIPQVQEFVEEQTYILQPKAIVTTQRTRLALQRVAVKLFAGGRLDDLAKIHHRHTIGYIFDDR